jgi:hypothetical protein
MSNLLNEIFHEQLVSDTPFKNIMRLVSVAINSYYVNYLPNHRVAKNQIEIYESHKFGVVRSKNCIEYGLENDDVLKLETGLLEKIYKGNNFEHAIETKYYENSYQQIYINRDNIGIKTKIKIPHVTPLSFKKEEKEEMLDLLQKKKDQYYNHQKAIDGNTDPYHYHPRYFLKFNRYIDYQLYMYPEMHTRLIRFDHFDDNFEILTANTNYNKPIELSKIFYMIDEKEIYKLLRGQFYFHDRDIGIVYNKWPFPFLQYSKYYRCIEHTNPTNFPEILPILDDLFKIAINTDQSDQTNQSGDNKKIYDRITATIKIYYWICNACIHFNGDVQIAEIILNALIKYITNNSNIYIGNQTSNKPYLLCILEPDDEYFCEYFFSNCIVENDDKENIIEGYNKHIKLNIPTAHERICKKYKFKEKDCNRLSFTENGKSTGPICEFVDNKCIPKPKPNYLDILKNIDNTIIMKETLTNFLIYNLEYNKLHFIFYDFKIVMSNLLNSIFNNKDININKTKTTKEFKNIMRLVSIAINCYTCNYLPKYNHTNAKKCENGTYGIVRSNYCIEYGLEIDDVQKEKINYYEDSPTLSVNERETNIKMPHIYPLGLLLTHDHEKNIEIIKRFQLINYEFYGFNPEFKFDESRDYQAHIPHSDLDMNNLIEMVIINTNYDEPIELSKIFYIIDEKKIDSLLRNNNKFPFSFLKDRRYYQCIERTRPEKFPIILSILDVLYEIAIDPQKEINDRITATVKIYYWICNACIHLGHEIEIHIAEIILHALIKYITGNPDIRIERNGDINYQYIQSILIDDDEYFCGYFFHKDYCTVQNDTYEIIKKYKEYIKTKIPSLNTRACKKYKYKIDLNCGRLVKGLEKPPSCKFADGKCIPNTDPKTN